MQLILEETVPAKEPWSRVINKGDILKITDLEGQQAVDFLCYDAENPKDLFRNQYRESASQCLCRPWQRALFR